MHWGALLLLWSVCAAPAAEDIVLADFEGPTYGAWTTTGEAFGTGPAQGTLPGQMPVSGYQGHGLVNTFLRGDGTTGTLTSPPFVISRRYLKFLIGGGQDREKLTLSLLLDGQAVRVATGPNDKPGGSERLDWASWDVAEFAGRTAQLRIVDQATGGWGHLNVDQLTLSDTKPPVLVTLRRDVTLTGKYLHLPVKTAAEKHHLALLVGGQAVRELDIELALGAPDWWANLDVSAWRGQPATLVCDRLPEAAQSLAAVSASETERGLEGLYHELLRPQFHFTARRGWNNDPNGLVWLDGEWHLFFQHNPYGVQWGNMHWGHAVSRDLVHWTELGEAIYPDALGPVFSGSAVIDERNTSGFGQPGQAPLVCVYTAAGARATQCLAYSLDRGRTFTKYAANPALGHLIGGNRDPKVFWYAPQSKWVMALFLDQHEYGLFDSPDLKQWRKLSTVQLAGVSECPELFEIALDGRADATKWVFYGGTGSYLVGRFDGTTFTPESGPHPLHHGNGFYASQTYNHVPAADGRRIQIGWGTVNLPGMPFNQQMTFPTELTLRTTPGGPRLCVNPVREIETLHGRHHTLRDRRLQPGENPLRQVAGELFDLRAVLEPGEALQVGCYLRGLPLVYDVAHAKLSCGGCSAEMPLRDGRLDLRVLVDRASVEIYADGGRVYLPVQALPSPDVRGLDLFCRGGAANIVTLDVAELKSCWP